jgi:hypothetical protein
MRFSKEACVLHSSCQRRRRGIQSAKDRRLFRIAKWRHEGRGVNPGPVPSSTSSLLTVHGRSSAGRRQPRRRDSLAALDALCRAWAYYAWCVAVDSRRGCSVQYSHLQKDQNKMIAKPQRPDPLDLKFMQRIVDIKYRTYHNLLELGKVGDSLCS